MALQVVSAPQGVQPSLSVQPVQQAPQAPLRVQSAPSAPQQATLPVQSAPSGPQPASLPVQSAPSGQQPAITVQIPKLLTAIQTAVNQGGTPDVIVPAVLKANPDLASRYQPLLAQGQSPAQVLQQIIQEVHDGVSGNDPQSAGQFFVESLKNAVSSAGNLAGGIASAVIHPVQTVENVGNLGKGLAETYSNQTFGTNYDNKASQMYNNLTQFFADRYGSPTDVLRTFHDDPFGMLADVATVLSGGAGIAGKLADVNDISKLGELSEVVGKAGASLDPTVAAAKGVSKLGSLAPKLEEMNLRLTPTQRTNLGADVEKVSKFVADKVPAGNPEDRLAYVNDLYEGTEQKLQDFLTKDAKDVTVPRQKVINELNAIKDNYRTDRDSLAIDRQVNSVTKLLDQKHAENIPVADLNDLKRSTFKNAFSADGLKVRDDVEYDIGNALYKNLQDATKGMTIDGQPLKDFNSDYSTLIQTKKLLKTAAGRNQVGIIGKGMGAYIGNKIGQHFGGPAGEVLGTMAGEKAASVLAGTAGRSRLGKAAKAAGNIGAAAVRNPAKAQALTAASRLNRAGKP